VEWPELLFIDNAGLYSTVLEGMWKGGEAYAKILSVFLRERRLKGCKILDVPCGIGRVAVPLAKLGYSVTGIDFSPHLVDAAKKKARKFSVTNRASFAIGKMKDVGSMFPEGYFDVAINIFTSIGYGSDQDDLSFFTSLRRAVKSGGFFIISGLANRDYLISHSVQNLYEETGKVVIMHQDEFDVMHSRMKGKWSFYLKDGKTLKLTAECPLELRLYTPHELVKMLERTGWKTTAIYDSLTFRRPYSSDVNAMTLIAQAV
jgi:SAM-dependent methyltransferase